MCNTFKQLDHWPEFPSPLLIQWDDWNGNRPSGDVRPTDPAQVIRWIDGRATVGDVRWGFAPPPGRKTGPVINYRSDGRRFGPKRCLVPAEMFYEFTGERSPKTKWTVRLIDGTWMCLAGIWRDAQDGLPETFSLLTTEPGPDIVPIHDREMVTIAPEHWERWLTAADGAQDLLKPRPAGTFRIEQAPSGTPAPRRKPAKSTPPATGTLL